MVVARGTFAEEPHVKQDLQCDWRSQNFATAWRDYRTEHVVSQHAARTIRNFLAIQVAESAEADVEEDEDAKRAPWEHVDTSWVSLPEITKIV